MGLIETTYDADRDLTIVKATGKMTAVDFHNWTTNYYAGPVTSFILWDVTRADLAALRTDDALNDTFHTKNLAGGRKGGKTAIVTANDLGYGMGRMLETLYGLEQMPFEVQVFNNLEEAMRWIGSGTRHDDRDDGQEQLKLK